ncbi:outer membrane transport energization protein ExbD [Candidatus Termititenax persephonae]|uniref:Outer membrane transport energization protein ExbD n=1 Tax=Candidatus Termititenax persephonae TaxID=2218525 RepID=A0A388TFJ7_9BACT|nr:outer membrane transport energization protein ExbD [Candidatus Termititenax persephonae]
MRRPPPHIDLVPLLDTIFLLLFFFLCAAILQPGSLATDLSAPGEQIKKYHTITITKEQVSGLDEATVGPVLIKAEADVDFGRVSSVLRRLQERKVQKINFAL